MKPPPNGERARQGASLLTAIDWTNDGPNDPALQAICEAQWHREAVRLHDLYRQTGNQKHLQAHRRHVAAMGGRARRKARCSQ